MTGSKISHRTGFWRTLMSVIAILCVVLSSCVVKSNIKTLLGVKHPTEHSSGAFKQNGKLFLSANSTACLYEQPSEASIITNVDLQPSHAQSVFVHSVFYSFLSAFGIMSQADPLPSFHNRPAIIGDIPLFLSFRKLII